MIPIQYVYLEFIMEFKNILTYYGFIINITFSKTEPSFICCLFNFSRQAEELPLVSVYDNKIYTKHTHRWFVGVIYS